MSEEVVPGRVFACGTQATPDPILGDALNYFLSFGYPLYKTLNPTKP